MLRCTIYLLALFFSQWKAADSRVHPENQTELVELLLAQGKIKSKIVADTMLAVDRWHYTEYYAYEDDPQPIGFGLNMSTPTVHAQALELLKDHLKEGSIVLDVGSGSGYMTACMAMMVGRTGHVIGIEIVEDIVHFGKMHVLYSNRILIKQDRVTILEGDGRNGYLERAPYDVIYVGAAAPEVPKPLLEQLKVGGRMLIGVGQPKQIQRLKIFDKISNETIKEQDAGKIFFMSAIW